MRWSALVLAVGLPLALRTALWSALVLAVGLPVALRTALPLLPAEVPAAGRCVGLAALLAAGLGCGEMGSGEMGSGVMGRREMGSGELGSGGPSAVMGAALSRPSLAACDGL